MKFKRFVLSFLVLCLLGLSFTSCKEQTAVLEDAPPEKKELSSGTVAENNDFLLDWDESQKCILLKYKTNSVVWSTIPYDFFLQDDTNVNLSSPLFINYYNPADGSLMSAKAFADCIELDNLSVTSEDGGVKMQFYFQDAEILIPLEIRLTGQGIKATIKAEEIKESGKTKLIDISVLPYFCSTANAADHSDYLFLPVGSGALMYTDADVQEFSRSYSGEVYGKDASRHLLEEPIKEEAVRLPVFGVKAGDDALLAIMENGAESARISADAGNVRNGYSTAYATFTVRGYDETEVKRADYTDAQIYADEIDQTAVYTVGYYPLHGENANYSGMAAFYRKYLSENGDLMDSQAQQMPYALNLLGGSLVKDVTFGVPYTRMQAAATFKDAQDMISELIGETGVTPSVVLKGYLKDGLDAGRIAGGFAFSPALGGKKQYHNLQAFCKEQNIPLFTEYDLIHFTRSGGGFSKSFDTAETAAKQLAAFYPLHKSLRTPDESADKVRLLKRAKLEKAVDKLLKKTDRDDGLSLSALGSIAYSDYSATKYSAKGGMAEQVQSLLKTVKESGHPLNIGAANGYAAVLADSISDVPLTNGGYFVFDASVPFYQMVFHGHNALYSTSLNLSADAVSDLLYAAEGGVSPGFTLTANASNALADALSNEYYGSLYAGSHDSVTELVAKTADYFRMIGDREILSHRFLSENVTVTEFSGGVTVYVNHGKQAENVGDELLQAESFRYRKDGVSVTCSLKKGGQ